MFDFYASDHHLNHHNIIVFDETKGVRNFATIEEHNEHLIAKHNAVVGVNDRVLFNGDLAFNTGLPLVARMNGRKWLAMGNHEHKHISQYLPYFEDIKMCYEDKKEGVVFSHFPIHPSQLENRWKVNVHGHLHTKEVKKEVLINTNIGDFSEMQADPRYVNISMERIGLAPIAHADLYSMIRERIYGKEHR